MTIYITFTAYAKQYDREVVKNAVISYEVDWGNNLPLSNDQTNDRGVAKTQWNDAWEGKTIYVYCNDKFVTSMIINTNCSVDFNVDYPHRDPRR